MLSLSIIAQMFYMRYMFLSYKCDFYRLQNVFNGI